MNGFGIFFGIISIIFFFQSLKIDKNFMETRDPNLYPTVKSWGRTAKVFFVISCFRLGFGLVSLFTLTGAFSEAADFPFGDMKTVFAAFSFNGFFTLTTFIIGLSSVKKFKEAEKAYSELSPSNKASSNGFNAANPYGTLSAGGVNGANYGDPNYNTNTQSDYRSNLHTNDPAQLSSSTKDQTPFEAPPPNYYNYNYGNFGGYQQGKPNAAPYNNQQNGQQKASVPPVNNTANYRQQPVNNSANVNKTEPRQYVSQMPEVTSFSEPKPSVAANTAVNTADAPQKPMTPVILPAAPEIKRESTVRCKHCGVTNKAEDKFCTFCGKSLSE